MDFNEYFPELYVTPPNLNDRGSMIVANGLQFGANKRIETVTAFRFARLRNATNVTFRCKASR